jgi:hypothetical protein
MEEEDESGALLDARRGRKTGLAVNIVALVVIP